MPANLKTRFKRGFTLVELLVVIVILVVLMAALAGGYGRVIESSRKKEATEDCVQLVNGWSLYHQRLRAWPSAVQKKNGRFEMDPEFCKVIGRAGFFDVSYHDPDDSKKKKTQKQIDSDHVLEFGMLSPVGRKLYNGGASPQEIKKHLYQVCVDIDENGLIDENDGAPGGVKVTAEAIVWCYGKDAFKDDDPDLFYATSWR